MSLVQRPQDSRSNSNNNNPSVRILRSTTFMILVNPQIDYY